MSSSPCASGDQAGTCALAKAQRRAACPYWQLWLLWIIGRRPAAPQGMCPAQSDPSHGTVGLSTALGSCQLARLIWHMVERSQFQRHLVYLTQQAIQSDAQVIWTWHITITWICMFLWGLCKEVLKDTAVGVKTEPDFWQQLEFAHAPVRFFSLDSSAHSCHLHLLWGRGSCRHSVKVC